MINMGMKNIKDIGNHTDASMGYLQGLLGMTAPKPSGFAETNDNPSPTGIWKCSFV